MKDQRIRLARDLRLPAAALFAVFVLGGCASSGHRAPVEDRTQAPRPAPSAGPTLPSSVTAPATAEAVPAAKLPPGTENAGRAGYYTIKSGDTLIRIGLDNGQNWRDIVRWNGIENANLIEVGQVVRVAPPVADPGAATTRPVATGSRVDGRPLDATRPAGEAAVPAAAASPAVPAPAAGPAPAATRDPEDDIGWAWPAAGPVASGFDEGKSKGLAITGKSGDPVLAAADGRVVYAGSGLRGYGNLVIVKHNTTYLTAYAHNQALMVKEDQVVRRGQKIAEMGSTDAERVQLHFEIRRQGKPIDPARLLPPR